MIPDTAPEPVVAMLRKLESLAEVPTAELEWLAVNGITRRFEEGAHAHRPGDEIDELFIYLEGRHVHYLDRGAGARKVMEWSSGDISGALPYSRLGSSPGTSTALEASLVLAVPRARFGELVRACPKFTEFCVHRMLERTRSFSAADLHDEKMVSLGRMSAGLAHELNNPASAAARSAGLLGAAVHELAAAAREIGAASITPEQDRILTTLMSGIAAAEGAGKSLSAIELGDRADELADLMEEYGCDADAAPALVEAGLTAGTIEELAASFDASVLPLVLRRIAAECTARTLLSDVSRATSRVNELVGAIKRFSYMDRGRGAEAVDVAQGLHDTVALMSGKAADNQVIVEVDIEPALPRAYGVGVELNQVWANLLDNAIDFAPHDGTGRVRLHAARQDDRIAVSLADNGPGVPAELRLRIFDPFVTTKPVGKGIGMGLDIARRLVRAQNGDISVESTAGMTTFTVTLPTSGELPSG